LESGAPITRYRVHARFDAALSRIASGVDADLLKIVTQRLDGDEMDLDVWIDRNGTLRAMSFAGTHFGAIDNAVPGTLPSSATVMDLGSLDDLIGLSR
jgi:hypothetical protein